MEERGGTWVKETIGGVRRFHPEGVGSRRKRRGRRDLVGDSEESPTEDD
jgi:hypothetical protein